MKELWITEKLSGRLPIAWIDDEDESLVLSFKVWTKDETEKLLEFLFENVDPDFVSDLCEIKIAKRIEKLIDLGDLVKVSDVKEFYSNEELFL